jgi:hypothetical protein
LDGVLVALFRLLGYQHRVDHLDGHRDVKQQGLLGCRGHHDQGRREEGLQLLERLVRLVCPLELVRLFQELEEGQAFLSKLADKET